MPNVKNIIIFLTIGAVFVAAYIFFIKPSMDEETPSLVADTGTSAVATNTNTNAGNVATTIDPNITQEFLNLLLNVRSIKLNDSIFADPAFDSLVDSSIVLVPDGNEGRVNPFAQFGSDAVVLPVCVLPQVLNTTTNTCVTPVVCTLPKVLNPSNNTCVTPAVCTLPKVLDTKTNTCVNPSLN